MSATKEIVEALLREVGETWPRDLAAHKDRLEYLFTRVLTDWAGAGPSAEAVDRHLDAVLKASGSGLRNYSMAKTLAEMRAAMREAMAAGSGP